MTSSTTSTDQIRIANWSGSIPVVLTLAPASLGTTMMPHPIHLLLNRGSFVHVGLKSAIRRLHKYAPATISFSSSGRVMRTKEPEPESDDGDNYNAEGTNNHATEMNTNNGSTNDNNNNNANTTETTNEESNFPTCWLEDEETQLPLRWQLFAGVLYDMMRPQPPKSRSSQQQQQQLLPWKLRLHFSQYPSSQLLPLEENEVWTTIARSFKNSLKQALFLEYNNSKVAMNMSKQIHHRLWDSIESSNYKLYQQINLDLQASSSSNDGDGVQLIPIRVFVDSKPPLQRPCPGIRGGGGTTTVVDSNSNNTDEKATTETTLGSLLLEWLPDLFCKDSNGSSEGEDEIRTSSESCRWLVAGVTPPLSIPVQELWQTLCHPDHFLYVIILTR